MKLGEKVGFRQTITMEIKVIFNGRAYVGYCDDSDDVGFWIDINKLRRKRKRRNRVSAENENQLDLWLQG